MFWNWKQSWGKGGNWLSTWNSATRQHMGAPPLPEQLFALVSTWHLHCDLHSKGCHYILIHTEGYMWNLVRLTDGSHWEVTCLKNPHFWKKAGEWKHRLTLGAKTGFSPDRYRRNLVLQIDRSSSLTASEQYWKGIVKERIVDTVHSPSAWNVSSVLSHSSVILFLFWLLYLNCILFPGSPSSSCELNEQSLHIWPISMTSCVTSPYILSVL